MPLSPAHQIFLALLRPQPDARFPLHAVLDLDAPARAELTGLLAQHALSGWAHRIFKDAGISLPPDLSAPLLSSYNQNTAHSILALRDYEHVSRTLSSANIAHIPLKGIRLLETLYPDPGTRHLSDIDVLVHEADVPRADEALRVAGWRGESSSMWDRQERFHHHHGYEPPPGLSARLELHWKVASGFAGPLSPDDLWTAATRPHPSSLEFRFSPHVELVTLLMHIASHGYNASPKWLLDVRLFLESQEGIPSQRSSQRTQRLSGEVGSPFPPSPLYFSLQLVSQLCGSSSASLLASQVRPSALRALALEWLAAPERFLAPQSLLRRKWPQYGFFVALNDGPVDQARLVYRAVAYKLGVEGVRLPRFLDRLVGGGS